MDTYDMIKKGEKGAWIGIAAYIFLSILKVTIGSHTGSDALVADGWNNTTDIIATAAVLIGLKISRKPPDHDHPYGHFRAQTIASLLASFVMATVGVQVVLQAVRSLKTTSATMAPDMLAAWIALFGAAVMFAVYLYNARLARRINNDALKAAAMDNRSDAFVSVGAFVGIIAAKWGWGWLDTITALLIGLIICKTAWDIFKESTHSLTDGFDEQQLQLLRQTIAEVPRVRKIEDIRARRHGNNVLVDVVVQVSPNLSVVEGHQISDEIEQRMDRRHQIKDVQVHVEPGFE